jgi:hypothetical protein
MVIHATITNQLPGFRPDIPITLASNSDHLWDSPEIAALIYLPLGLL